LNKTQISRKKKKGEKEREKRGGMSKEANRARNGQKRQSVKGGKKGLPRRRDWEKERVGGPGKRRDLKP